MKILGLKCFLLKESDHYFEKSEKILFCYISPHRTRKAHHNQKVLFYLHARKIPSIHLLNLYLSQLLQKKMD